MEFNDEIYLQKYKNYKKKYLELKNLNNNYYNNDLTGGGPSQSEGGMFEWVFGKKNNQTQVIENNKNINNGQYKSVPVQNIIVQSMDVKQPPPDPSTTDGEYLVFFLKDEEGEYLSSNLLNSHKLFVQENYEPQIKEGLPFANINQFNLSFNETGYIIIKRGNEITFTMINNKFEPDFYKKLELLKQKFNIGNNNEDRIITDLTNNCYKTYTDNVNEKITSSINDINNLEVKTKLNTVLQGFNEKNSNDQKQLYHQHSELKTKLSEILENKEFLKYNTYTFKIADYYFGRENSEKFLTELADNIIKFTNREAEKENIKFNMIIKFRRDGNHYTFADYIHKYSISITKMYTKIVSSLAKKRYDNFSSVDEQIKS
jgi:hypothetical protein